MKMKRLLLPILIVLIVTSSFYSCRRQQAGGLTIRDGVLSIGMEPGYPPMEYYADDGVTLIGFDVELGKALAERMGLRPDFVDTAWDGIFAGVETGRYDVIISSVTITPARLNAHNFSNPYVSNSLAMVIRRGSGVTASSPEATTGLQVAFQGETTADHYMARLRDGGLRFTERKYDRVMNCFDELALGRVDVVVTDFLVAYDYASAPGSQFDIVWISEEGEQFGIVLKKGNDALTDAVNKALDELFNDGTMLRISMNVFGMDLVSMVR